MINLIYHKLERLEMTEKNLIDKLTDISKKDKPSILTGAKSIYLGSPWFTASQEEFLMDSYKKLIKNPSLSFIHVPLLGQYKNVNPFTDDVEDNSPEMKDWAIHTFYNDISGMDNSDVMIALIEADNVDTGTIWESAYMFANHKPTVFVVKGDTFKMPLNLMPAMSATAFITPEEIEHFDFRRILTSDYVGKYI